MLKFAFCAAVVLSSSSSSAEVSRYRTGGWDLRVFHDRFTERTSCAIMSVDRRLAFQPGAMGFQVGKRRNTVDAWFRIDGGSPVRWQDREAALIAAGAPIDGPALDNPTGGMVWIPTTDVGQAKDVAIRPSARDRVQHFRPSGFASIFEAAGRLGCRTYVMSGL